MVGLCPSQREPPTYDQRKLYESMGDAELKSAAIYARAVRASAFQGGVSPLKRSKSQSIMRVSAARPQVACGRFFPQLF